MIDQLADAGMRLFTFTGGEPLLRKDFVLELVEYLAGKGIYSRLFTNGFLLTEDLANTLKNKGLCELQVSLDGLEKTHDEFRGIPLSFKHALEAMKYSKAAGIPTFVRITVIPQNVDELPELIELLEKLEIDGIRVRPFVSVGRGKENKKYIPSPQDFERAFTYLTQKRRHSGLNLQLLSPSFAFLFDKELNPDTFKPEFKGKGCTCGTELCAISPDGWLKACGYFSETLGNVKNSNISELWSDHKFVCRLRKITKFDEFCMKCKYLAVCGGGCRASAFENLGSMEAPDPLCPLYRKALESGEIAVE